ncbi:MAG: Fic family protein [bacterium]
MNRFSQHVTVFHGRSVPEEGSFLVGYTALINAFNLKVPLPAMGALIGPRHKRYHTEHWAYYTPRHAPEDSLAGHLTFALKYEGVELAILSALFAVINSQELQELTAWVQSEPTGRYSRRIWFFYEWLTQKELALDDAKTGKLIDAIDPKQQFPGPVQPSRRHRVNNNLPGSRDFCPLVRCTEKLKKYCELRLDALALKKLQQIRQDLIVRASAFLMLKDSRASFQIEQEQPAQSRAERWGAAIGQAGIHQLSKEELLRLQKIVLEENRFITLGFRREGGFIGTHDRMSRAPIPDHISARWEDIDLLIDGMLSTYQRLKKGPLDPVILAATIAFGFVFIHPFSDGNGRIHRYLIHHVLAETGFIPKKIVLPFSAVILEHIDEYKKTLEAYSQESLKCIIWSPTDLGNIEVLNQTIDLYRYFDATGQAEFLYDCVYQALTSSLPNEIDYLERYDHMKVSIKKMIEMPDREVSLLISFLEQNNGLLSKRARSSEFKALSDAECQQLEELYVKCFCPVLKH